MAECGSFGLSPTSKWILKISELGCVRATGLQPSPGRPYELILKRVKRRSAEQQVLRNACSL